MAGPANARLVASIGAGGTMVVAIGAIALVLDVVDGTLVTTDGPVVPPGAVTAAIAVDLDGDCDDDVFVATDASPPTIWRPRRRDLRRRRHDRRCAGRSDPQVIETYLDRGAKLYEDQEYAGAIQALGPVTATSARPVRSGCARSS